MHPQIERYEEGDIVYDIFRPQQLMIITKCKGVIYYCRLLENKNDHPLAFMHRDLRKDDSNST